MLQIIIEYLNTIKRYSGQTFIKFERDKDCYKISFCVHSIRIFTKFSGDPYYEPLAWFIMTKSCKVSLLDTFHIRKVLPCYMKRYRYCV